MFKLCKIIFLILLAQVICAPSAHAISKLSSFMRSVKVYMNAAQDYATAAQEKINEVMTEALKMKSMVESGELSEMMGNYAISKAAGFTSKKIANYKEKREKKKALKKKEDKLNAAKAKKEDRIAALEQEKADKNRGIDAELNDLKVKVKDPNLTADQRQKIADQIADMEKQKEENLNKPIESDKVLQGMDKQVKELDAEVKEGKTEVEGEAEENLNTSSQNFLAEETDGDTNKSIYETEINAMFLKENEESTSENLARIKRNRRLEHYKATENALQVAFSNILAFSKSEVEVKDITEAAGDVEGNFAVKAANTGVIIEHAKVAARYAEALLADMRLKTTKDMMSWNNKNRLYDYKKPVTEFDLDYYELKKENIKDKAKAFYEQNKDKGKEFYDKNKDNIKELWRKI